MKFAQAVRTGNRPVKTCWSLTQADIVFCAVPIAVFLSIVSLV
jgi:hypothetical protein